MAMRVVAQASSMRSLRSLRSTYKASPRTYVRFSASASASPSVVTSAPVAAAGPDVRCRFAPSPTGNLHVGGARTALFNWLYARKMGGKFIVRVEDTDKERSTRESEEAVLRDLRWLGLDWDEGPGKEEEGEACGPYRQSERTSEGIYAGYVSTLLEQGKAYKCFCTEEELEAMRREAEEKKLPPKYAGKWATADQSEVEARVRAGEPYSVRFRVPKDERVTIDDVVRGSVSWSTDTLGDFVIMRSNGLPVYNFCVAIDDAMMKITHVLRAEEHLPNTLRQVLIYDALGFQTPTFGHVSLILAPDKSKLSKRHGATSVGEFAEMGYLPEAMVNYLTLLGWNDGTEQEIYSTLELVDRFELDRLTKSAGVFDKTKLTWMNGQHLRDMGEEKVAAMIGTHLAGAGLVKSPTGPFVEAASGLVVRSIEIVSDASKELENIVMYPLAATLAGEAALPFVEDNLEEVASAVLAKYDSGELKQAVADGTVKDLIKAIGKDLGRKGKRLFMPIRILLTGSMKGPEVGEVLALLACNDKEENATEACGLISLDDRMAKLRQHFPALAKSSQ